jgi:hypothetical protein
MAGWIDNLMNAGWGLPDPAAVPSMRPWGLAVGQEGPAQFDEYGNPVPVQSPAIPAVKKKPIEDMAPQAGIVAPQVGGLGMIPGQPAPAQQAVPAPPAAAPSPSIPTPRPRPPQAPTREVDGADTNVPTDISSSDRGSTRPQMSPDGGQAQPAGPSMFGRIGNFLRDNSNTLLAIGAGFGGAPNIGQGISRTAAAAIPASQADLKNRTTLQSQSGTYRSLIDAGVPPNQALGAIGNPEMMKALIQSYITDRGKDIKIIKDSLGNEVPYVVNKFPKEGEPVLTPAIPETGSGGMPNNSAAARLPPNYDPETKRDEAFLSALDPVTASAVKDIADGKVPATGRNLQKLMPLVTRYENGFDNTTYQSRQNLQKSYYGGGEGAKALRSANTTIDHGIQLRQAIDNLHNFTVLPGFLNPATGAIQKQYDPAYQKARKEFQTNAELYAKELDFALTGKSTVSGQNHIREMFNIDASPEENRASLQRTLEMLDQRVGEHENTYNKGMNKRGGGAEDMLSKRKELNALLAGEKSGAPAPTGAPPPGRYRYDPNTGTMIPAQ